MASDLYFRAARLAPIGLIAAVLAGCGTPLPQGQIAGLAATLAANDSATTALEAWCTARGIATPPIVTATVLPDAERPAPPGARKLLAVETGERLGYRHVRLACGDTVLSEAHNWYLPDRLTPAMNRTLETTRVPFGKATAALGWHRERLGTLPPRSADCPRGTVLGHRALLRLPDGRPLALLVECYTRANVVGPVSRRSSRGT